MNFEKFNNQIKNSELAGFYWLLGVYTVLSFIFFGAGYKGELIDDGLAGLVKFENQGWKGFGQSFGFTSLYYFHDIFVLAVYGLFGKSVFGWFTVMVTLHSLNAVLSFTMFKKFYYLMGVQRGALIAFIGAILFLLSPYQTENVLWAATLHYSIALLIFLVSSILLLNALQTGRLKGKTVFSVVVLYSVSLLTLEISLIFPFAYLVIGAGVIFSKRTTVKIRDFVVKLIVPLLGLIVLYFIATRVIKGHWLPHYGETHLLNNDIKTYSTNFARYLVKTLGFVHFTSYQTRDLIYTFCSRWKAILIIEIIIPAGVFFLLRSRKKLAEANVFLLLTALAFIMLWPSLHMFFMYLFATVNDRLGYFFSLVIYQLVSLVFIALFSCLGTIFMSAYGLMGIYFLYLQTEKWRMAGTIQDTCVQSFIWPEATKVFVLSAPTYYKGVYVFRNDERIPYAMDFFRRTNHPGEIEPIISFCSNDISDSTIVEVKNDSTLQVSVHTGGWLMKNDNGAVDYSTTDLSVRRDKWQPSYQVVFHNKPKGAVYIYSTPGGFRELKNWL